MAGPADDESMPTQQSVSPRSDPSGPLDRGGIPSVPASRGDRAVAHPSFPVSTSCPGGRTRPTTDDRLPSAVRSRTPGWETRDKSNNSSMENINSKIIRSTFYWAKGYTGEGVTVALIDTGVVPVNGLIGRGKGRQRARPLLRWPQRGSALSRPLRARHPYGRNHCRPRRRLPPTNLNAGSAGHHFLGVAPDAQILNVKVGDGVGSSDVSQVIAGLNWVVTHRNDAGMNVRVINLAYGIDPTTDYQNDELAYAVEAAWKAGIVVVVAAGNDGNDLALRNPAFDPFVLAVGAVDTNGTQSTNDDMVPAFSNCGTAAARWMFSPRVYR